MFLYYHLLCIHGYIFLLKFKHHLTPGSAFPLLYLNTPLQASCNSFWNLGNIYSVFLPPENEVCEGYVFYMCLSFCSGGGGKSAWVGTPRTRYPPGPGTPTGTRYPPGPGTPPRTRHTPSEQVPPTAGTRYTPLGSSACWEIRATSGWYASYWNAFLST